MSLSLPHIHKKKKKRRGESIIAAAHDHQKKELVYDVDDPLAVIGPQLVPAEDEDRHLRFWKGTLPRSMSDIVPRDGRWGDGSPLMEVLNIRIIPAARKQLHKLPIHGSVILKCGCAVSRLFRRTSQNPQVIRGKDTLTLMGPDSAPMVHDYGEVILDIKYGGREVCKGCVCYNSYAYANYPWDDVYNRPLVEDLTGKNGIGRVTYAIFPCGMLLQVEMKLPKMEVDNFKPSAKMTIYGKIDASITGEMTAGSLTTTLFSRKHPQPGVLVSSEGDLFPLSKNLISFPFGGTIEIDLHLKEQEQDLFKPSYSNIVKDVLQCTPKQFGNHKCTVDSKYGPIELKLIAYPADMHPKSFLDLVQFLRI